MKALRSVASLPLACALMVVAQAQDAEPELYGELERLYHEVIGSYLADGLCPGRSSAVEVEQAELAAAVAQATAATGDKVLLFAVAANSLADVIRLNEQGAARTGDQGSLLHVAARFADPPMLEYLVSAGFALEEHGGASGSALLVAASDNRRDNVAWLIARGADVNAADSGGGTALTHSLVCKDQGLVDELIAAGAVPDARTYAAAEKLGITLPAPQ